jgi:signal transduction histidine kinase
MFTRMPLALKISLVVALAVAVSTAALAVTVLYAARTGFGAYLSVEAAAGTNELRPLLEQYYSQEGSWDDVEDIMMMQQGMPPQGMGRRGRMGPGTTSIILVDTDGEIAFAPAGTVQNQLTPRSIRREGVPLQVDGQTVGYLVLQSGVQEEAFYRSLLTTIIRAGAITALLAVGVGLLMTRSALRPLAELEDATKQVSAGDLAVRVPVRARDEVGALAERFNMMASNLQDQDAIRRRMMNDIAHELRTPLTVMQGQIEALEDGVFELTPGNLEPVHEQTLLLKRLVNDLRDLALAESGQIALDMATVELDGLVPRVANRFASQAQSLGIDLQVAVQAPVPAIQGDAQRIEQVLNNLLSNSLRHTPPGGRVTVALSATSSGVRIAVQDTGEGIPAEDLPHVFERFYRSDRARQRGDGHTGLGLAIARELVRAHGGDISASSVPGQGTTVSVDLPAQRLQAGK